MPSNFDEARKWLAEQKAKAKASLSEDSYSALEEVIDSITDEQLQEELAKQNSETTTKGAK